MPSSDFPQGPPPVELLQAPKDPHFVPDIGVFGHFLPKIQSKANL